MYGVSTAGDDTCMVPLVDPIIRKYNVTAYLHGHKHNLQHLFWKNVHYVDSGHGGDNAGSIASSYSISAAGSGVLYAKTVGGFAVFQAKGSVIQMTFVNETGANVHCSNFTSTRIVHDTPSPTIAPSPAPTATSAPVTKVPTTVPTPMPTGVNTCHLLPKSAGALSFLVWGDWGTGAPEQYLIANQVEILNSYDG